MRRFQSLLLTLSVLGLVTLCGCNNEYGEFQRHGNLTLKPQYTDVNGHDALATQINGMDLFIFSDNGVFIKKSHFTQSEILNKQGIKLSLPAGNYHFLTWANIQTHTLVKSKEGGNISEFSLSLDQPNAFGRYRTADPLFFNNTSVQINGRDDQIIPIKLFKENIPVSITLEAFEPTISPKIIIKGGKAGYDMTGEINSMERQYELSAVWDDGSQMHKGMLNILRTRHDDPLKLELLNENDETIFLLDLQSVLDELNLNLEEDMEPMLTIHFKRLDKTLLGIRVNNWYWVGTIEIGF